MLIQPDGAKRAGAHAIIFVYYTILGGGCGDACCSTPAPEIPDARRARPHRPVASASAVVNDTFQMQFRSELCACTITSGTRARRCRGRGCMTNAAKTPHKTQKSLCAHLLFRLACVTNNNAAIIISSKFSSALCSIAIATSVPSGHECSL